jgi:hypothetical protein
VEPVVVETAVADSLLAAAAGNRTVAGQVEDLEGSCWGC